MKLKDVMTRNVEVLHPDSTLQDAAARMQKLDVGLIPVCDGDIVQGMLTDRDITVRATAEGKDPQKTRVRDVMTVDVLYCYEDDDVRDAAKKMGENQVRRLLVLNQDHRLVGIVSLGDLAVDTNMDKKTAEALEQISLPAQPRR